MAGGIEVTVEFPELEQIRDAFRGLPKNLSAKYMAAALGRAIDPGFKLLKTLTPKGPTGNLRRAIRKKTKQYTKTGSGVALAGFTAPPRKKSSDLKSNEKGQHQGFLEFGTKRRKTKGNIASSYSRSGPVRVVVAKRSGKVTTRPKSPKGFVRVVKKGGTVDLGEFPVGGKAGVPPIKTAFDRTRTQVSGNLNREMTAALNSAIKEMASPFRAKRGGNA
jgi:hypothetical protein